MSFIKGRQFENFAQTLFPSSHYKLLHKTPPHASYTPYNPLYAKPDFQFRDKSTDKCFYVEAKYRSCMEGEKLVWCNDEQLYRYKSYDKEAPVFILVGLGGKPFDPEELFLIPLSEIEWTGLYESVFEEWEILPDQRVTSRDLWG